MSKRMPEQFNFHPKTEILPGTDDASLAHLFRKGPAILKPDEGTQGDGIYIVTGFEEAKRRMEMNKMEGAVLQEYIPRPLLLHGLKFDIRAYVLILSLEPLRIFMCREGLVRVCSLPYEAPNRNNMHNTAKHLTNFSINKSNSGFVHNDDVRNGEKGSKRLLSAVLRHMQEHGKDVKGLLREVKTVIANGAAALAEALLDRTESIDPAKLWPCGSRRSEKLQGCTTAFGDFSWGQWQQECFHLLGFDVMLDERGKAYLLEVNCNPSLAYDSIYSPDTPVPSEMLAIDKEVRDLMEAGMEFCKGRGTRVCKCHACPHRSHVHRPCAIDIVLKTACVGGALAIVGRDINEQKAGGSANPDELVKGTCYEVVRVRDSSEAEAEAKAQNVNQPETDSKTEGLPPRPKEQAR